MGYCICTICDRIDSNSPIMKHTIYIESFNINNASRLQLCAGAEPVSRSCIHICIHRPSNPWLFGSPVQLYIAIERCIIILLPSRPNGNIMCIELIAIKTKAVFQCNAGAGDPWSYSISSKQLVLAGLTCVEAYFAGSVCESTRPTRSS